MAFLPESDYRLPDTVHPHKSGVLRAHFIDGFPPEAEADGSRPGKAVAGSHPGMTADGSHPGMAADSGSLADQAAPPAA